MVSISGSRSESDSPCIGICSTTGPGGEVCLGCGRTANEVIYWNTYSVEKRIEINRRLVNDTANSRQRPEN